MAPTRPLILYHAHCADGFGAAFAAWKKLGSGADYVAVNHGDPPPPVAGRDVVVLDFAYPRATTLALAAAVLVACSDSAAPSAGS